MRKLPKCWRAGPVFRCQNAGSEREKLLRMEQELHSRDGQNEAVEAVSNAIRRSRRPSDPEPSDWFLPVPWADGVGKTNCVKALANFMFDSDDAMVRIDMFEFMEVHLRLCLSGRLRICRCEEGGYLTEAVRRRPYSVILLDEVEKLNRMYSTFCCGACWTTVG